MKEAQSPVVDRDIEEMLDEISREAFAKRLYLFNDDYHHIEEVILQVMLATEAAGKPCTRGAAESIAAKAHKNGQTVMLTGDVDTLQKAKDVLDRIWLRSEIRD